MEKIDYLSIFKNAWNITKENIFLWIFGFFIFISGFLGNFFSQADSVNKISQENKNLILEFIQQYIGLFALFLVFVTFVFILTYIVRTISQAAIIKAIDNIALYRNLKFKQIFSEGKKYFWKMFLMEIIIGSAVLVALLLFLMPILLLIYFNSPIMAVVLFLAAVTILIPLFVISFFLKQYGYYFIVLGDFSIKIAIMKAYDLFKREFRKEILFVFLLFCAGMVFFCVLAIIILALVAMIGFFGILIFWLLHETAVIVFVSFSLVIILPGILVVLSVYETFKQIVWILFFKEIAMEKNKDEEKEIVLSSEILSEQFSLKGL